MKTDHVTRGRRLAAALVVAGTFAVAFAASASAGQATSDAGITAVINGQKFENKAVIVTQTATDDASAFTYVRGRLSVPAGEMGARARLYTAAGTLVTQSSVSYTGRTYSAYEWFLAGATYTSGANGVSYYSQGTTYHWTGSAYTTYTTLRSPNQTS